MTNDIHGTLTCDQAFFCQGGEKKALKVAVLWQGFHLKHFSMNYHTLKLGGGGCTLEQ